MLGGLYMDFVSLLLLQDCSYIVLLNMDLFIDASEVGGAAQYINHSCSSRCHMVWWLVAGEPMLGSYL